MSRRSCRVDRPASALRLQPLAALALALSLTSGCNLILGNEQRALRETQSDASTSTDAGQTPTPATDASAEAGTSENDAGEPDAGRVPAGCPSSGRVPECTPNRTGEEKKSCGLCGLGQQTRERSCNADCTWGDWGEWNACLEYEDVCQPGIVDEEDTGPCGDCDSGSGMRTRFCTESCGWSDWSPIVCTPDPLRCEPNTMEMLERVACPGMCSSRPVTRSCNDACTWDEPVMGECTAGGVCAPGETRMTMAACNEHYCNKGEQQQMETCSESCTWGSPIPIGVCAIPSNVCRPLDLGSTTGWRCRPGDPDFRELCHPSTASEAERCTWGMREPYEEC